MIAREIRNTIEKALARQPAVAIIGPRQVGKTTLALDIASKRPSVYLDLESYEDRSKLKDPILFFNQYEDSLVILDEIHRMPELVQTLRGVIDHRRRQGKKNGCFLILGSASIDLLRQSGESLAGRIAYINMPPLHSLEVPFESVSSLWLRGGFPESFLAKTDDDSFLIRKDFIRTYLEREILQFGPRVPSEALERLWMMLAHSQGTMVNVSQLASNISTTSKTLTTYIDLLCDLLLVRRLRPFYSNLGKRLVKTPKVYIRDSGMLHALLGIKDMASLLGHPIVGQSFEGFVIENILSVVPAGVQASFYRTAAGAEIDLILEFPNKKIMAIEIKSGFNVNPRKGFYSAIEALQTSHNFIVYSGKDSYPIAKNIQVISLPLMMKTIIDQ